MVGVNIVVFPNQCSFGMVYKFTSRGVFTVQVAGRGVVTVPVAVGDVFDAVQSLRCSFGTVHSVVVYEVILSVHFTKLVVLSVHLTKLVVVAPEGNSRCVKVVKTEVMAMQSVMAM